MTENFYWFLFEKSVHSYTHPIDAGLGHIACFGQQKMCGSDKLPIPNLGLKRHCAFPLNLWEILDCFHENNNVLGSHCPFNLCPKRKHVGRPEFDTQPEDDLFLITQGVVLVSDYIVHFIIL